MDVESTEYLAAVEYLYSRINYEHVARAPYAERQLKLDRMRRLLTRLDNPDAGLPIVHIAGTKGKGSTAALLAGMAQAANYEVGVFSSPHLERIEERFVVGQTPCRPEELIELVRQIRPVVAQLDEEAAEAADPQGRPTFFEIVTAIALLHFRRRRVDLAILEVGLGGRLDATNVTLAAVSAITSISRDHTQQLGDTLPEIAAEKAGIIKPGVPVVVGKMAPEPRAVIERIARSRGCRTLLAGRDFKSNYEMPGEFSFSAEDQGAPLVINRTPLSLRGRRQADNAAVASMLALELRRQGWLISAEAIRAGLASTHLPGRIEIVGEPPRAVIDVSHNVASAEALVEYLQEHHAGQRRVLIFAGTRDKDVAGIARVLLPHFEQVWVTEHCQKTRAVPADDLARLCRPIWKAKVPHGVPGCLQVAADPKAAWQAAVETALPGQLTVIAGSFFLAAELRPIVRGVVVHS